MPSTTSDCSNYHIPILDNTPKCMSGFLVYIHNTSDPPNTERKRIQCSVCQTMEKSILFACESEHIVCTSCQLCDGTMQNNTNSGEDSSENEFNLDTVVPPIQVKKSPTKVKDFAGGDCDSGLTAQGINGEVKKSCIEEDRSVIHKELRPTKSVEVTMEYKNPHFQESKTSISANTDVGTKITENNDEDDVEEDCEVKDPRPVMCPVSKCLKIVTIDSFLLHFLFDHSKIPRTTLDDTIPQEITLKSANFSTDLQCVATFIMETQKRPSQIIKKTIESSAHNPKKDNKLLLLLSVRFPTSRVKYPNGKCEQATIYTRNIYTQTEKMDETYSGINTDLNTGLNKSGGSDNKSCSKPALDEDEVLLLWLCKLDEAVRVFSITLLGEDKRRGYCYIGDAVHVREKQDPSLLYDRSECLIVKGSAINRLFDPKGQITAIVSLIG